MTHPLKALQKEKQSQIILKTVLLIVEEHLHCQKKNATGLQGNTEY